MFSTTTAQVPDFVQGVPVIPRDVRIADWICSGAPCLGLRDAETVGDVEDAYHDCLYDCPALDGMPSLFVGADGRVYAADVAVVIRPATPAEVSDGVHAEKEEAFNLAGCRIGKLEGYLRTTST